MRAKLCQLLLAAGLAGVLLVAPSSALTVSSPASAWKSCPPGYVDANLSWGEKCLRAGEFCKAGNPEYRRYGFDCSASGHLVASTGSAAKAPSAPKGWSTVVVGRTVLLAPRTRTGGCRAGSEPDQRCSPGAYYGKLTAKVICSGGFRTSAIRNVPESEKHAVEAEYGITPGHYGRALEIDHIIPLELGGSNEIANLFPERLDARPGYRVKDRLENRLHDLVCSGQMTLRVAQRGIATGWERLYTLVYGAAPGG